MNLIKTFSVDSNFWDLYPNLKVPEVFSNLYKDDKSKKKEDSSKIMWAICLCYDTKSEFYNLPLEDRIKLVEKDYLKKDNILKSKEIKPLIEMFTKLSDTPALRQLRIWNNKMDEKTSFIEKTPYNDETWEMLDKMILNNKAMYAEYMRIQKELVEEGIESSIKGDKELSLSDSGEI